MIDLLIWLMGKGERPPIVIDICEMTGFALPLALGIMLILRRGRRHGLD